MITESRERRKSRSSDRRHDCHVAHAAAGQGTEADAGGRGSSQATQQPAAASDSGPETAGQAAGDSLEGVEVAGESTSQRHERSEELSMTNAGQQEQEDTESGERGRGPHGRTVDESSVRCLLMRSEVGNEASGQERR